MKRTLITGPSGCGKTTLAEALGEEVAVDMDVFGGYEPMKWTKDMAYIVRTEPIEYAMRHSGTSVFVGNCRNIFRPVQTVITGRLGREDSIKHRDAVSTLDWDRKIFLWYEPTAQEFAARFGSDRVNNYGKDPVTRREVINYLHSTSGGVDEDFEFIDVTGIREVQDLIRKLDLDIGRQKLTLDEAKQIIAQARDQPAILLTDGEGSYRGVFVYDDLDLLAIVKMFPNADDEADKWSIKFYEPAEALARVMTYWHTIEQVDDTAMLMDMTTRLLWLDESLENGKFERRTNDIMNELVWNRSV